MPIAADGVPAADAVSGLAKAGRILLLVAAILAAAGAAALVLLAIGLTAFARAMGGTGPGGVPFVGGLYAALGVLLLIGAGFAFAAQRRAQRGDWHGAWALGLVASLLPPVQVLTLVGAVLCLSCPEHDAQMRLRKTAAATGQQPGRGA